MCIFWLSKDSAHLDASEHILAKTIITEGVLHHSGLNYKFQSQKLKAHMQLEI